MDPLTLFALATAATIVGVTIFWTAGWLYTKYYNRRNSSTVTPIVASTNPVSQPPPLAV